MEIIGRKKEQQRYVKEGKIRSWLITMSGLKRNGYSDTVQNVITGDELFRSI